MSGASGGSRPGSSRTTAAATEARLPRVPALDPHPFPLCRREHVGDRDVGLEAQI
jgi:hypothetical protein